jgi:hypothetical protein
MLIIFNTISPDTHLVSALHLFIQTLSSQRLPLSRIENPRHVRFNLHGVRHLEAFPFPVRLVVKYEECTACSQYFWFGFQVKGLRGLL